ncbi:MAG: aminomethyl-transferring glycine dehydrogenase subunit GcvPA [Candidatus Margulisbacteria bacterium]|nr:aminomethyl-transferring glycine dehydrogenase subunit GcvPA [Candidatus Margulisiibacteriota bacterium]
MTFPRLPNTDDQKIFEAIGVKSIEELLKDLPNEHRLKQLSIPEGLSEQQVFKLFKDLGRKNNIFSPDQNFLGAGVYYRYIPAAVDYLASRSEYYTAYTPYQPEISQGTLTAIFEFQTYMSELTGMEISNASLYDGATAMAESLQMAARISAREKHKFAVIGAISPFYKEVLNTYNAGYGFDIEYFEDIKTVQINKELTAVVCMYPDFFGRLTDYTQIIEKARQDAVGIIFGVLNPLALALFKTPGEFGADIVFGEAVSLGNYPSYGGPSLGFITTKKEFVRHLPGRIVGETQDKNGQIGYVLTFQTREQHIRREKATSNICSNQGLMALRSTVYMSLLGREGAQQLASDIMNKTRYLKNKIGEILDVKCCPELSFQEIVIKSAKIDFFELNKKLKKSGIQGGFVLEKLNAYWDELYLVTVNEMMSEKQLDIFVGFIKESIKNVR